MQSAASQASSAVAGARSPQLRPALAPPAGTPDTPFSAIMDGAAANDPPSEPPPAPRQDAPPAPTTAAAPAAPTAPAAAHGAPVKAAQNDDKASDDQKNPAGTSVNAAAGTLNPTSADQDTLTADAKAALKAKTTAGAGDDGSANTSGTDPKPKADADNDAAPVAALAAVVAVPAVPTAPAPTATPMIAPFVAPVAAATPQATAPSSTDAETAIAAITAAAGGPAAMGAGGATDAGGPAGPSPTPAAIPAAKPGAIPAGAAGGNPAPADPAQIATAPASKPAQPAAPDAAKLAGPVPSAADATAAPNTTEVHPPAHGKDLASEDKSSAMRALGTDTLQIDKAPTPPGDTQVQTAAPAGDQSQAGVLQSLGAPAATTAAAAAAAPPALAAAAAAAVPIAGVAIEIAAHAHAGSNRFEIRLDPPDLGRIDVRLDVDRQGNVTSHLVVERSATLDLLRRDAPQLERALQDAGLKTTGDALQFSLSDQGAGAQHRSFQDSSAARLARVILPSPDIPPVDTVRSYGRRLGANGGVDIRV